MPRIVPLTFAVDFIASGRRIGAADAQAIKLIDKFSIVASKDRLLDASLAMSRSEKVRDTPVASRRLSSLPLKGDVTNTTIGSLESRMIKLNDPIKLSVLAAVKAAYLSGSFEEGLEMESNILSVLSRTDQSRGTQYHFFNNRLSRHANTCPILRHAVDYDHFPENLLLYLSKPSKNDANTWETPIVGPGEALRNVTIIGSSEKSLVIAKMCARKGNTVHILQVL